MEAKVEAGAELRDRVAADVREVTGFPPQLADIIVGYARLPAFLLVGGRVALPQSPSQGIGDALPVVQAWTPGNQDWEDLPPMLDRRDRAAVALANGILFVMGGLLKYESYPFGATYHRSAEMLPLLHGSAKEERKWVRLPPMLAARAFQSGAVLNGRLYAFGGSPATSAVADVPGVAAEYLSAEGWKADAEFGKHIPRAAAPRCAVDYKRSRVYFLADDGIRRWDAVARTWESPLPLPPEPEAELAVAFGSLAFLNDVLYCIGDGHCFALSLRAPGASWETRAEMPYRQGRVLPYQGHLYIFGGKDRPDLFSNTDTVLSYSPAADEWTVRSDVRVPDCRRAFSPVSRDTECVLDAATWKAVQQFLTRAAVGS